MASIITILPRKKIAYRQWDDCVAKAKQVNPFMYTWALDALCQDWMGLVVNDYEGVMPLPYRKKWGIISYVYQVPFMPYISYMGNEDATNSDQLLHTIFRQFAFARFDWYHQNLPEPCLNAHKRTNLTLSLSRPYHTIYQNFTEEGKKNIKKSIYRNCAFSTDVSPELVMATFDAAYGHLHATHTHNNYQPALRFIEKAAAAGKLLPCKIIHATNGNLLAAGYFIKEKNELQYWLSAPTPEGRNCRAPFFMINSVIETYAGSNYHLNFLGSDLPNVAHFYQQFSPQKQVYFEIRKRL